MSEYRKIEGMLYGYYRKKARIDKLNSKLIRIQNRINRLRRDLKECNIELGETLKAMDYSSDSIKTNSITSNIEIELSKAVNKIIREMEFNIRDKYKTKNKIVNLEKQTDSIDILLSKLTDEELQLIELRYGEQSNFREMERILHMGKSTLQRKKDKIICFLINENK